MAEPFLAEIRIFGFNFAPSGWASCDGQILAISQNTALFSLLGTTYGGNGTSNFALPNLQGSFAVGQGQGPGLNFYAEGQTGGEATHTLSLFELPGHTHALNATASATTGDPTGASLANVASGAYAYRIPGVTAAMATQALAATGGGQPHNNLQPYLGMLFCIAMQGIFPSRA